MNEKPKYFNKLIKNFLFSNLNGELLHNVKEIYDNQIEIEKKKDEITKNLNQIEMLRKKLETDYSE